MQTRANERLTIRKFKYLLIHSFTSGCVVLKGVNVLDFKGLRQIKDDYDI